MSANARALDAPAAASIAGRNRITVAILSDIHYAGEQERVRGRSYEMQRQSNPLLRAFLRFYRRFIWMRNPFDQAPQFHRFLNEVVPVDYAVVNGDYSCDSGFIGVSDPAAGHSAAECLGKLREKYGDRVRFTIGDHELGKLTMFGGHGGMRLASWTHCLGPLGLQPFWQLPLGNYVLIGVTSSLIALPAHQPDTLPDEWPEWQRLREAHLAEIRAAFTALAPRQRVILFCHDPTALPFLWREPAVQQRLAQIDQTILGHLHTKLILWKSRVLSGIPPVHCLGHAAARFTTALNEAHYWWPFKVRQCPALSGIELLNDGGYYLLELDPTAQTPPRFVFYPLPR